MCPEMEIKSACQSKPTGKFKTAYLCEKETSLFLNMSVQWLRKNRENGTGPAWVKFGHAVRYPIVGLEAYAAESACRFTGQQDAQNED